MHTYVYYRGTYTPQQGNRPILLPTRRDLYLTHRAIFVFLAFLLIHTNVIGIAMCIISELNTNTTELCQPFYPYRPFIVYINIWLSFAGWAWLCFLFAIVSNFRFCVPYSVNWTVICGVFRVVMTFIVN